MLCRSMPRLGGGPPADRGEGNRAPYPALSRHRHRDDDRFPVSISWRRTPGIDAARGGWHGKYHGPGQAVRSGGQPANPVRDHLISSASQPCNQIFDVMLRYDHPRRIIARRRPNCHYKPSNDGKLQIRQVHLDISADHVQMSCSHAFDVLGQIHGLCKQGVAGHRCVLNRSFSTVSSGASLPGFPYLQPTRKECDLHAAIARIVAMRQGIDNGLNYDFLWNLISYRCLNALCPRAHRQHDFAQHKIQCLTDQVVCITLWPRSSSIWTV